MKADIFFFISSVATVVLVVLFSILMFYLIKAGKNLHMLLESLKNSFNESEEFIEDLKERLENNIIFRLFFPPARKHKKHKTSTKEGDSKK